MLSAYVSPMKVFPKLSNRRSANAVQIQAFANAWRIARLYESYVYHPNWSKGSRFRRFLLAELAQITQRGFG